MIAQAVTVAYDKKSSKWQSNIYSYSSTLSKWMLVSLLSS